MNNEIARGMLALMSAREQVEPDSLRGLVAKPVVAMSLAEMANATRWHRARKAVNGAREAYFEAVRIAG